MGRALSLIAVAVLSLAGLSAWAQDKEPKDDEPKYPEVGSTIPGPFNVLNVTGERKGRYHCLVCRNALNAVGAVYVRTKGDDESLKQLDVDQPLPKLLKKLDTLVEKNIDTNTGTFAIFLAPKDQEFAVLRKLEKMAADLELKRLVLAVANEPPEPEKPSLAELYKLPKDDEVFVLFYAYHRVTIKPLEFKKALTEEEANEVASTFQKLIPKLPVKKLKIPPPQ